MDGGTHRLGVLTSACFVGFFFFSSLPLGHYIPKWYLGGLFMGSGVSFLEGSFLSYRGLPPSRRTLLGRRLPSEQYLVTVLCILVAALTSPNDGIAVGLALSILLFLLDSSATSPVSTMSDGRHTVSRTLLPFWELRALRREGERILLLYLQGQLFFGSGQSLATSLVEAVQAKGRDRAPVGFCILSFSRVQTIDASAAEQLRSAVRKVARHGCKVLCCRTSEEVFSALAAAQVILSPDEDLREVLAQGHAGHREDLEAEEDASPCEEHSVGLDTCHRKLARSISFKPIGRADHDAFDHETDALDYCDDKILAEFCYGGQGADALEPHMLRYRHACQTGQPLDLDTFERVAGLPAGAMEALRPYCEVRTGLSPGTELKDKATLFLIVQGAVSMVDVPRGDGKGEHRAPFAIKGFHGRGGKRLRKRFGPGTAINKISFTLGDRQVGADFLSSPVVSGKFSSRAEVWGISRAQLCGMPPSLQQTLREMVALQLAIEREHTLLSGD